MITLTLLILVLAFLIVGIAMLLAGMPFFAFLALDLILPIAVVIGLGKLIFGRKKK